MRIATLIFCCVLVLVTKANENHFPEIISGSVIDTYGEPLLFANVWLADTNVSATTDIEGNFVLSLGDTQFEKEIVLQVQYVGYIDFDTLLVGQDFSLPIDVIMYESASSFGLGILYTAGGR